MTLLDQLLDERGGPLHATLIDPATTSPADAAKLSERLARAGTDLILLGGSTGVTPEAMQATVDAVKEACDRPVVLFPSSSTQMAGGLDGILYTLTFNSTLQACIIEEQARGAGPVMASGIEVITTAYVIVDPGMTVGRVTEADLVPRDELGAQRAGRYADLARVLGMDAIYLEAGSGAPDPVPPAVIEAARAPDLGLIVGGGIRTPDQARAAVQAGADLIVTGTLAEQGKIEAVTAIIDAIRT